MFIFSYPSVRARVCARARARVTSPSLALGDMEWHGEHDNTVIAHEILVTYERMRTLLDLFTPNGRPGGGFSDWPLAVKDTNSERTSAGEEDGKTRSRDRLVTIMIRSVARCASDPVLFARRCCGICSFAWGGKHTPF